LQTLRHNREPYETKLNEEVVKEFSRQEEEKRRTPPNYGKDIYELGTRMDAMECTVKRLEANFHASADRMEAMMRQVLKSATASTVVEPHGSEVHAGM
jgi:hypothetical protein